MKKTITIVLVALFLFSTLQAQPKKVAILEPSGNFSIIQKAILQAKLAEVLTNSGGYDAFNNSDTDRELICITELADANNQLLVVCKLVEQISGKVLTSTEHRIANKPITEFEKGCIQLAFKLAWWSTAGATAQISDIDSLQNGIHYCPDGIDLVYVECLDTSISKTNGFFIGMFEVTQAQWKAIMGNNYSHFISDNLPVENASWWDAQGFLARLNVVTGNNYRLPTETEWEFAARGGTLGKGNIYSGSANINNVAWYYDNSGNRIMKRKFDNEKKIRYSEDRDRSTHPVGTKEPNELGIFDMTGNVWEWCEDWYDSSQRDKAVRGGGWDNNAHTCIISTRTHIPPSNRDSRVGFRVVLSGK